MYIWKSTHLSPESYYREAYKQIYILFHELNFSIHVDKSKIYIPQAKKL